jgi:signal peptidase I
MKRSQHRPSIFLNILLLAGLVGIWIAFAPTKIGGWTSYVMVNGISMEPGYHTGDLVIVRKAQTYQAGDVVAYRDAQMGAYIIHRIIGIEQGGFVLKGDNNSWRDPYHPTLDEIVGKQWIYAPKLAGVILWFRTPVNLSLTLALLGGVLMSSMIVRTSQGQKEKKGPSIQSSGWLEGSLYLLGLLLLGFLGLSIFAFAKPITRPVENIPYIQDGNYFYSATGMPGVYDTNVVRPGEPVFPKITCFLNIGLTYNILGGQFQNVAGTQQMSMRVMDEQSGWQRTIPMIAQTAFTGSSFFSAAALDLCQVQALLDMVEQQTGLHTSTYTLEIVANISFSANTASGQMVTDTFDPALTFNFDKVHLYLAENNTGTNPLHSTAQGSVSNSNMEANTLSILGSEYTVGFIRLCALLGLGMSLSGLVVLGALVFNAARQSKDALIRLRYGSMLMDVYGQNINITSRMIDVASIEDLAKMAERQNAMILHTTFHSVHYYLVQSHAATYRYILNPGKNAIAKMEPDNPEIFERLANDDDYVYEDSQPMPRKSTGYGIHIENVNITTSRSEDAEILRRIKI